MININFNFAFVALVLFLYERKMAEGEQTMIENINTHVFSVIDKKSGSSSTATKMKTI